MRARGCEKAISEAQECKRNVLTFRLFMSLKSSNKFNQSSLGLSVPTTYLCTNSSNYAHSLTKISFIRHHLPKILWQKVKNNHWSDSLRTRQKVYNLIESVSMEFCCTVLKYFSPAASGLSQTSVDFTVSLENVLL